MEIRELSKSCETSEMRLKTGGNFPLAKLTIAGRIEGTTMDTATFNFCTLGVLIGSTLGIFALPLLNWLFHKPDPPSKPMEPFFTNQFHDHWRDVLDNSKDEH